MNYKIIFIVFTQLFILNQAAIAQCRERHTGFMNHEAFIDFRPLGIVGNQIYYHCQFKRGLTFISKRNRILLADTATGALKFKFGLAPSVLSTNYRHQLIIDKIDSSNIIVIKRKHVAKGKRQSLSVATLNLETLKAQNKLELGKGRLFRTEVLHYPHRTLMVVAGIKQLDTTADLEVTIYDLTKNGWIVFKRTNKIISGNAEYFELKTLRCGNDMIISCFREIKYRTRKLPKNFYFDSNPSDLNIFSFSFNTKSFTTMSKIFQCNYLSHFLINKNKESFVCRLIPFSKEKIDNMISHSNQPSEAKIIEKSVFIFSSSALSEIIDDIWVETKKIGKNLLAADPKVFTLQTSKCESGNIALLAEGDNNYLTTQVVTRYHNSPRVDYSTETIGFMTYKAFGLYYMDTSGFESFIKIKADLTLITNAYFKHENGQAHVINSYTNTRPIFISANRVNYACVVSDDYWASSECFVINLIPTALPDTQTNSIVPKSFTYGDNFIISSSIYTLNNKIYIVHAKNKGGLILKDMADRYRFCMSIETLK